MDKYMIAYRGGEITATVEAKDESDAVDKFLAGEGTCVSVELHQLWPDMVTAEKE